MYRQVLARQNHHKHLYAYQKSTSAIAFPFSQTAHTQKGTQYEIDYPETNDSAFGLPWHEPRQYRIHINQGGAASYVKERIWSEDQQIFEQPDGSIILTITSQSEQELLSWVNSFGGEAKIISGPQAVAANQKTM